MASRTQAQAAGEWTGAARRVCRSRGAETFGVCQEPGGCCRGGLQGSPGGTSLPWVDPEDKSWASGQAGLGLRVGCLAEAVRRVAPWLPAPSALQGRAASPPLCVRPLRRPTPKRRLTSPPPLLSRPLLPSGPLVSPCTAARSFSLMGLFWLPGEWEEGGWERGNRHTRTCPLEPLGVGREQVLPGLGVRVLVDVRRGLGKPWHFLPQPWALSPSCYWPGAPSTPA